EERQIATCADERAFALFLVERAAARALCAVLAEHRVLAGRKPFSPVRIGQISVVDRFGRCHWSRLTEFGRKCERRQRRACSQKRAPIHHRAASLVLTRCFQVIDLGRNSTRDKVSGQKHKTTHGRAAITFPLKTAARPTLRARRLSRAFLPLATR